MWNIEAFGIAVSVFVAVGLYFLVPKKLGLVFAAIAVGGGLVRAVLFPESSIWYYVLWVGLLTAVAVVTGRRPRS